MPPSRVSTPNAAAPSRRARRTEAPPPGHKHSARPLRRGLTLPERVPMLERLMSSDTGGLTWSLIEKARARIADKVNRTPVLTSATLDALSRSHLYFKCENLQKCGAFKARGATNAVFALPDGEAQRGVATHSSGNHAAALARAARLRGIRAYVVMPENATQGQRARGGGRHRCNARAPLR